MAITENIVTGKKYRVCIDADKNEWDRVSMWTAASDVELQSGESVETALNSLNENLNTFQFRMNDGNGEYKLESEGADAWRPFKSGTKLELLWEGNKNISSWSGGLIDVDLSNYQGLIIYGYAYNGAGDKECSYIDLNNIINNAIVFTYYNMAYTMYREFTINDNKITFASKGKYPAGSDFNVATSGANYAIPCEIYGVPR